MDALQMYHHLMKELPAYGYGGSAAPPPPTMLGKMMPGPYAAPVPPQQQQPQQVTNTRSNPLILLGEPRGTCDLLILCPCAANFKNSIRKGLFPNSNDQQGNNCKVRVNLGRDADSAPP